MAAGASGFTMTFGKKKIRSIWDDPDAAEIIQIPLEQLHANPFNPRVVYRDEDIAELAESIEAEGGVLQDLSVAEVGGFLEYWRARLADTQPEKLDELEEKLGSVSADDYVILIGHNRKLALAKAGITAAPCKVTNSKIPRARLLGLPENMRRVPLNPIEEALGFQGALQDGLLQTEIAAQTGCKQPHISKRIKLLKLPYEVQQAVMVDLPVTEAEILADKPEQALDAWRLMKAEKIRASLAQAKLLASSAPESPAPQPKAARPVPHQQTQSPNEPTPSSPPAEDPAPQETEANGADRDVFEKQTEQTTSDADSETDDSQAETDPSTEAANRRVQACRVVLELGLPSNPRETVRVLAPALLTAPSKSARETAHEWLRTAAIGPAATTMHKYFAEVSASGDAKLTAHAALAVALAVAEERAAADNRPWDAQDRDYLAHLKAAAHYEPTDWESERLRST